MLYENLYYMVFKRQSVGNIWSSICIQDISLHYQINLIQLICLISKSDEKDY